MAKQLADSILDNIHEISIDCGHVTHDVKIPLSWMSVMYKQIKPLLNHRTVRIVLKWHVYILYL